jgi:hypothetical protein
VRRGRSRPSWSRTRKGEGGPRGGLGLRKKTSGGKEKGKEKGEREKKKKKRKRKIEKRKIREEK